MGCERVPQRVRGGRLRNARATQSLAHRALERLIADVMSPLDAASWIERATIGRKHVLPAPIASGARVFPVERLRQPDSPKSGAKIACMKPRGVAQLHLERLHETVGKHRDPILPAFPLRTTIARHARSMSLILSRAASMMRSPVP